MFTITKFVSNRCERRGDSIKIFWNYFLIRRISSKFYFLSKFDDFGIKFVSNRWEREGERGGLHQNISKVLINASNNIEIFFLSKFEVFESNIFCRIGATEGGILSKYSKVLTVLRQLADRHLADRHLADIKFRRHIIWPTWTLADTTFGRHDIWPTRHLADMKFRRHDIWSTRHLVNTTFGQHDIWPTDIWPTDIWPNWNFSDTTFGRYDIWQTRYLADRQLADRNLAETTLGRQTFGRQTVFRRDGAMCRGVLL